MIYEFIDRSPEFDETVFIAPSADLIGDVAIGSESSVWFHSTIRGDVNRIRIGERSNIQDNCCIHVTHRTCPVLIGSEVTVGHSSVIHGCTIGERVLIGIQSTVLDNAVIEPDVILGAGSLVPPGKRLGSGYLYLGSPARKVRPLRPEELESIRDHSANYVTYARAYRRVDTYDRNPFYESAEE